MSRIHKSESGAALLSVLLIVALMSVAALAMIEGTGSAITQSRTADARASLAWHIAGTEEAGFVGVDRLREGGLANINDLTPGFRTPFEADINGAAITTLLEDASNCFNLNSLRTIGDELDEDNEAAELYLVLLIAAGLDESDAEELSATLMDWLDPDTSARLRGAEDNFYSTLETPYRTSGQPLASISELRAIRGYTKKIVDALEHLVCVRSTEEINPFNINTLRVEQAPLLSMAFGGNLNVDDALAILLRRPSGGWASTEMLLEESAIDLIAPEARRTDLLSIRSSFIELRGRLDAGGQSDEFAILYVLAENQPTQIVRRRYGIAR